MVKTRTGKKSKQSIAKQANQRRHVTGLQKCMHFRTLAPLLPRSWSRFAAIFMKWFLHSRQPKNKRTTSASNQSNQSCGWMPVCIQFKWSDGTKVEVCIMYVYTHLWWCTVPVLQERHSMTCIVWMTSRWNETTATVHTCTCARENMCKWVHDCMYVCMYVCTYVCMDVCTHAHTPSQVRCWACTVCPMCLIGWME